VSDIEVITFRPDPGQYACTFGGAAPAMRIRPPAVLKVFTEDCFAGPGADVSQRGQKPAE